MKIKDSELNEFNLLLFLLLILTHFHEIYPIN
jgi:hypothetical protein